MGKLAPKRFASLLFGVFFLSNASGYALAGTLGSILPATGEQFKKATEGGINLQDVLEHKAIPTVQQAKFLADNKISDHFPVFAGYTLHNIFEFFMVFVMLCGIASILLFLLTPFLKKMMHGIK